MYVDEDPYTIDVPHVEEMVWTTREAVDGDRVQRGRDGYETGDETGGPGGPEDETGDKTAATAGDERDSGDQWGNYTDEGKLEFDEDKMAALKGSV